MRHLIRAVNRETILKLAELSEIKIAREHRAGVIRNLEILLTQAEIVGEGEIDPAVPPAATFRP